MDDILTFNGTLPEHHRTVHKILELLRENHLFLKAEKCEFECQEIEYLGLVISENKVAMDPVKHQQNQLLLWREVIFQSLWRLWSSWPSSGALWRLWSS